MRIVNIIHVGEETFNLDELSKEKKQEIAEKLNSQALGAIGYKKIEAKEKPA